MWHNKGFTFEITFALNVATDIQVKGLYMLHSSCHLASAKQTLKYATRNALKTTGMIIWNDFEV